MYGDLLLKWVYQMKIEERVEIDQMTGISSIRFVAIMKKWDNEIEYPDRVYHNQYFYHISEEKRHLMVPSREAFHIFDNTNN